MVIKKTNMNQRQTIEMLEEMQMRIDSLQHTIDKMIMSGKFKDDDPRFKKLEDNVYMMEQMMMQISLQAGIKPYNINWPQPKKKPNEEQKNKKDQK
tara:strand:+ start:317 stop:604 length:288 start_codon:yes stop_codon:yes gene_type:complete